MNTKIEKRRKTKTQNRLHKIALTTAMSVLFLAAFTAVGSAAHIEIGTGTSTESYVPFYGYYDYGWSKIIYTQSEIGSAITITKIGFDVSNSPSGYTVNDQRIYMAHTTDNAFAGGSKPDPSTMTEVYNGSITWDGSGWHEITLSTPFSYDNTDNLLIYYENRDGSYASGYPRWYYTSHSARAAYKYVDGSFPGDASSTSSYVPNIRLYYSAPKTLSSLTVNQASTSFVAPGSNNEPILRLDFEVMGDIGTLPLNSIEIEPENTNNADVAANGVKLYYTTTTTFSTDNQLGTAQSFSSPAVFSALNYDLPEGMTYVWVTYDVVSGAAIGNTLDAKILANKVNVAGSTYPASDQDPAGSRYISYGPVHNLDTGENFSAIQDAIDDADTSNGHTITVDPGTYHENVNVDKRLTIYSTGGVDVTIVDGGGVDSAFEVNHDCVNITGFTVTNGSGWYDAGIFINSVDYCNISYNKASGNEIGIRVYYGSGNIVKGNVANDNEDYGISLYHASYSNIVTNNVADDNGIGGIHLTNADKNEISGNTANGNTKYGIYLYSADENEISGNTANHNGYHGIYLYDSNDNEISDNIVNDNDKYGIYLYPSYSYCDRNEILGNTVANNKYGIYLNKASDNEIACNLVAYNTEAGFYLTGSWWTPSEDNNISYNNIIENGVYNDGTSGWEWNFHNDQSEDVVAENNYWGTDVSSEIAASINEDTGDVDYEPFLSAPSPCAPISSQWLKGKAISDLEAINTTNEHSQKESDEAIKHISSSLDAALWTDESRLDTKHGNKVFDEEKKAVKHLMNITEEKGTHADPAIVDDVEAVIEKLTKADEQLAIVAISDAKNTPVQDSEKQDKVDTEIARAEEELAKAVDKLNEDKPDKAIDHYKKAWEHAQHAIKHAQG